MNDDKKQTAYPVTYWEEREENVLLKRLSDTLVIQVQVKGTDLKTDFHHNWEKVTFPDKERLDKHLADFKFQPSTEEAYNSLLDLYFRITDVKRDAFNELMKKKKTPQP